MQHGSNYYIHVIKLILLLTCINVKKTTFEKTVIGDRVAHVKQQKLDVSIDFHALFHHDGVVGFC